MTVKLMARVSNMCVYVCVCMLIVTVNYNVVKRNFNLFI